MFVKYLSVLLCLMPWVTLMQQESVVRTSVTDTAVLTRKTRPKQDTGLAEPPRCLGETFQAGGSMFPFKETKSKNNRLIREFSQDVDTTELIWHRDREDRTVRVLESNGWKLQLDNQLPVLLEGKKEYKIPKYMYHRVIKGEGKLVVEIEKHEG